MDSLNVNRSNFQNHIHLTTYKVKVLRQSSIYTEFHFNPFAGVLDQDISKMISPIFNLDDLRKEITNSKAKAFQFLGKQGRGKTTHLKYLHQHLSAYPIFHLLKKERVQPIIEHPSSVIFIDSIHHLGLNNRIKLFKSDKTIIYTTHWDKKMECLLAHRKMKTIVFKGITADQLQIILNKRLALAADNNVNNADWFSEKECQLLIHKFGDNFRGIINYLFTQYQ